MSQDEFWKQWSAGTGSESTPEKKSEPAVVSGDPLAGLDADTLSAWLKGTPDHDPLVPSIPPPAPATPSAGDVNAAWPPQKPVDPFAGLQPAGGTDGSDWDLALDLAPPKSSPTPAAVTPPPPPPPPGAFFGGSAPATADPVSVTPWAPAPAATPPAPAPPVVPPPAPANPFAPPAPAAVPAPSPADLGGFDLGGGFGAPPPPPVAAPAPVVSPFGPPPPPPPPPVETLQAAPLRLELKVKHRTSEIQIQGEALIGRPDPTRGINPEIDLRLDDSVSRRHAKIFLRHGVYVLTDLNSTNGTRINGEWLQPEFEVELKTGDLVEVGEHSRLRILDVPPAQA